MAKYSRKQLAQLILSTKGEAHQKAAIEAVANYLVSSGRSRELESLVREIELTAQVELDHLVARLSTAHQLDQAELKQAERTINKLVSSQSIEISQAIDPSLLGGIVINTPEIEADLSVKGRLARMKG